MSELGRLARGSAGTTLGGVVTALAAFCSVAIVARALGPAAAGVFGVCVALSAIVTQIGKLGCDTALVHTLPRWSRDAALRSDRERLLVGCLAAVGGLGVVAGVVAWLAAVPISDAFLNAVPDAAAVDAVRAMALGLPPAAVTAVALAGTRGLGTVRPLVLNDQVAKPLLRLLGVGLLLAAGGGVVGVLAVWSAVAWLLLPWALLALTRRLTRAPHGWTRPLDAGQRRSFVRYAVLRCWSASVEVVGLYAGLLVVSALLGAAEAGVYAVALRLVLAGFLTLQAVRLAVAPELSSALTEASPRRAERLHQTSSAWVVLTAWPLYLVLVGLAPQVLSVFGPDFVDGAAVLGILAIGGLVSVAAGNIQTVLLMGGLAGSYLGVAIASVVAHVAAVATLVPVFGVEGAAVGFVVACIVENGLAMLIVARRLGVRPVGTPVVAAALASAGTIGVGVVLARLLDPEPAGGTGMLVLVLTVSSLAHLAVCWRLRAALALDAALARLHPRRPEPAVRDLAKETT
jgi:O-antigen/teichoic acid export membrane protein